MDTATAAYSNGQLTVNYKGATLTTNVKVAPKFVVVGDGNEWNKSGLWVTRHSTRNLALRSCNARGEGAVAEVTISA